MTAFQLAQRFVGEIRERPGAADHPFIVWCLDLCGLQDAADEVPWCSAFVNGICWLLRFPRSKSARARSWLLIGQAVDRTQARVGDIVVLMRGGGAQPGPEVIEAQGHVGFFAGLHGGFVEVLGGNQGNAVSVQRFDSALILGIRRIV